MKKDIKDYCCEVTQEQANEAKELLLKYGIPIATTRSGFDVFGSYKFLRFYKQEKCFVTLYDDELTKVTYPEWKAILIEQYEKPKIRKSELLEEIKQLKERQDSIEKKVEELKSERVEVLRWKAMHGDKGDGLLSEMKVESLNAQIDQPTQPEKPEFWYVEKDESHHLWDEFKEWFEMVSKYNNWRFSNSSYGYSGRMNSNGYESSPFLCNHDKMQRITLEQWKEWFYKPAEQPRKVGEWYFFTDDLENFGVENNRFSKLEKIHEDRTMPYVCSDRTRWIYCLTYEEVQELINKK